MKIGLNGQMLTRNLQAGPEKFTLHLYEELAKLSKNEHFIIFTENEPSRRLPFKHKTLKKILSWTQISLALELFKQNIKVYFTPVHTVPGLIAPFIRTITLVHGLEFLKNKEFSKKPLHLLIHPFILFYVFLVSKVIIVPSQATKNAIKNFTLYSIFEKKIKVIHEGVDESFFKRTEMDIERSKGKYSIGKPYFIFISTIQPRKNIIRMIEAFSNFLKNIDGEKPLLLIAGNKGWESDKIYKSPEKFGVKENVKFLGKINDEDRAPLLSGALAYVNFSLEEGFGLPLLEAMRCECPMLVSDIAAHKEVSDGFGIFANPYSIDEMIKGFQKIYDKSYDKNLVAKAFKRSKDFSWQKTAKEIYNILRVSS